MCVGSTDAFFDLQNERMIYMKENLKNRWEDYCNKSVKRALVRLKKRSTNYNGLLQCCSNAESKIKKILNTKNCDLTEKDITFLKEYIKSYSKREEYERNAIYSQGLCDCFSIVEKYI